MPVGFDDPQSWDQHGFQPHIGLVGSGLLSVMYTLACAGMVGASLACLGRSASFVEVGKRDIWSPQRVAQERPDVAYHLIAIDFWTPEVVGTNLERLSGMLARGACSNLGNALPYSL